MNWITDKTSQLGDWAGERLSVSDDLARLEDWADDVAAEVRDTLGSFDQPKYELLDRSVVTTERSYPLVYGEQIVPGTIIWYASSEAQGKSDGDSDFNEMLHMVVGVCEGNIQNIKNIYINDYDSNDSVFDDPDSDGRYLYVYGYNGTQSQPASPVLRSESEAWNLGWRPTDTLSGLAYVYLRMERRSSLGADDPFGSGIPRLQFRVQGRRVRRIAGLDHSSRVYHYGTNPVEIYLDYLTHRSGGGLDIYDQLAPYWDDWRAAAEACNRPVSNNGNLVPLFQFNGVLQTSAPVGENLQLLERHMRARAPISIYQPPVLDIARNPAAVVTRDDLSAEPMVSGPRRNARYNQAKVTYTEIHDTEIKRLDAVFPDDATLRNQWLAEDGHRPNSLDVMLPGINNESDALRMARYLAYTSRPPRFMRLPVKPHLFGLTPGDVLDVDLGDNQQGRFVVQKFDRQRLLADLTEQVPEAVDEAAMTTTPAPPATQIPAPELLKPPHLAPINYQVLRYQPQTFNGQLTTLRLTIEPQTASDIYSHAEVRWRPLGSRYWQYVSGSAAPTLDVVLNHQAERHVQVQARPVSRYNARRQWQKMVDIDLGVFTPPGLPAVTNLVLDSFVGREARIRWDALTPRPEWLRDHLVKLLHQSDRSVAKVYDVPGDSLAITADVINAHNLGREFIVQVVPRSKSGLLGNALDITVSNPAPAAPLAIEITPGVNQLQLSWQNSQDQDFTGTRLLWRKNGANDWQQRTVAELDNHALIDGLQHSSDYQVQLQALDAFGDGDSSSLLSTRTLAPIKPTSFVVTPGVNEASLALTAPAAYVGIKIWYGSDDATPVPVGAPVYQGADTSIRLPGLLSGKAYTLFYRALDAQGSSGALIGPVGFTTTRLQPTDLSGLSPWATKLDPIDQAWIADKLAGDAIASEKIANLSAAKLTAGVIQATLGIQSGGSIETVNNGFKTGLGVYDAGGEIYTLISADSSGAIKTGITADGVLKAQGAEIEGKVVIGGGSSGYAALLDKPTSLVEINPTEVDGLKTRTATILINKLIENGVLKNNVGEAVICAVDHTGAPDINSDGTILVNGSPAAIPRSPAVGVRWTVNTNMTARGWLVWNRSDVAFTGHEDQPAEVVFATFENGVWRYDNNSYWVTFTPNTDMWIIGEMTCVANDNIQSAELYAEAKPISRVSEIGATRNTGALADKDAVKWADDIDDKPQIVGFYDAFNGDINRWENLSGGGTTTLVSGAGAGGKILRVGDNDGDDQCWLIHQEIIPFNPESLYRVRCRIRRTAGQGQCYVGVAGVDGSGTFVNSTGNVDYSNQHYFAKAGGTIQDGWQVFTGYFTGFAAVGSPADHYHKRDIATPGNLHADCRGFRPLLLLNYDKGPGTYEVDYFSIDVVPDDMLWSQIGGDNKPADNATRNTGALADKDSLSAAEVGADPAGSADDAYRRSFVEDLTLYQGEKLPNSVSSRLAVEVSTGGSNGFYRVAQWTVSASYCAFTIKGKLQFGPSGRYPYGCDVLISAVTGSTFAAVGTKRYLTQGDTDTNNSLRVFVETNATETIVTLYADIRGNWRGVFISADWYVRGGEALLWQTGEKLGEAPPDSIPGDEIVPERNRGVSDGADVTDYVAIGADIAAATTQVSNALSKTNWAYSGSWHIDSKADAFEFVFSQIPELYKPYLRLAVLQNDLEENIDIYLNDQKFTEANGPDAKTEWLVFDVPDEHINATSDNIIKIGHNGTGPDDWGYIYQVKLLVDQKKMALDGVSWTDIDSRPSSLADLDSTASNKLDGIADGADVTDYDAISNDIAAAEVRVTNAVAKTNWSYEGNWRIAALGDAFEFQFNKVPDIYKPFMRLAILQRDCEWHVRVLLNGQIVLDPIAAANDTLEWVVVDLPDAHIKTTDDNLVRIELPANAPSVDGGTLYQVKLIVDQVAMAKAGVTWSDIDSRPGSLADLDSAAADKLAGIANGADATKTVIDGGLITTGGLSLAGYNGFVQAGKDGSIDTQAGFFMGLYGGNPVLNIGDNNSWMTYDKLQGLRVKGRVDIASGSGFNRLIDAPKTFRFSGYGYQQQNGQVAGGLYNSDGQEIRQLGDNPRSWTLSVFSRSSQAFISHDVYDLYDHITEATRLANDLNALGPDVFVVLAGQHAPAANRILGGLPEAVYRCGGTRSVFINEDWGGAYPTYVLIGNPGIGAGKGIEHFSRADAGAGLDITFTIDKGNLVGGGYSLPDLSPDADSTKTIIDGGLVTTGGIQLSGSAGFLRAVKTSYTDSAAGVWLGLYGGAGAVYIGDANEYLKFRSGDGLLLKTTDLTLENGSAVFSGDINVASGVFKVARAATTPVTTPNGTQTAVAAINSGSYGVAGLVSYSRFQYGVYGESQQGDGVRGISTYNDGGKFTSRANYKGGVVAENTGSGPQLVLEAHNATTLPYGNPGSLAVRKYGSNYYLYFKYNATHWRLVTMGSTKRENGANTWA